MLGTATLVFFGSRILNTKLNTYLLCILFSRAHLLGTLFIFRVEMVVV